VQNRKGLRQSRLPVVLIAFMLSMVLVLPASAQSPYDVFDSRTVFNVPDPPSGPYMAHQSILLFVPGAVAPLHQHGGPGFINILEGEVTLSADGEETIYRAGDSIVETTDKLYKGVNHTDADMVLMVTYLIPDGEEVTTFGDDPDQPEAPEELPVPLASAMQEITDPPGSFDLIHTTGGFGPGSAGELLTASGDTLLTSIGGNLDITINGETTTLSDSEAIMIDRDQEYIIQNNGDVSALFMSTEIVPDVHGIVPAAGATVDRTFAMWLVVLTAAALFVVGGVLRLSSVRFR
jgi:quercetin dioxygenase-like cupin family protein